MASTTLATVSAALSLLFASRLETQINSVSVLPQLLPVVMGGGKALNWTAEFTGATNAAATTDGVALSSSDADAEAEVAATLPWAQYTKVSSVSDLAQAAANSNYRPDSIGSIDADLLLGRIVTQGRRIALGIATDMYAGDPGASPAQLAGAALAIDSSGTFAGINPATYTEWAATEQTCATAALTFDVLRSFFTAIYDACGYMPEFVTCNSTLFNLVRGLFSDYEANVAREIVMARGGGLDGTEPRVVKLSAGMRAVEVDGVVFVLDRAATANTFYAWNTNFVQIEQLLPAELSRLTRDPAAILDLFRMMADNPKLIIPRAELEGMAARTSGLRPRVKLLGDRGMSTEAVVSVWAQLRWMRRNAFGKLVLT